MNKPIKKIALFGGTFNPFHKGHLAILQELQKLPNLDKIIIIPNYLPPYTKNKQATTYSKNYHQNRLQTLKSIIKDFPKCKLDLYEIKQATTSYTINTLRHFRKIYPNDQLFWVIGSDNYFIFHLWHNFQEVLKLANFIVINRDKEAPNNYQSYYEQYLNFVNFNKFHFINIEPILISSSEIRLKKLFKPILKNNHLDSSPRNNTPTS